MSEYIGPVIVLLALVKLVRDVVEALKLKGSRGQIGAVELNSQPLNLVKLIVIFWLAFLSVSVGVFFAAVYLWAANKMGIWYVGVALAALNVIYMYHDLGQYMKLKVPERVPTWMFYTIILEGAVAIPWQVPDILNT